MFTVEKVKPNRRNRGIVGGHCNSCGFRVSGNCVGGCLDNTMGSIGTLGDIGNTKTHLNNVGNKHDHRSYLRNVGNTDKRSWLSNVGNRDHRSYLNNVGNKHKSSFDNIGNSRSEFNWEDVGNTRNYKDSFNKVSHRTSGGGGSDVLGGVSSGLNFLSNLVGLGSSIRDYIKG